MSANTVIAVIGGLFSLLVAGVSGLIAYNASLKKFREEMQAQEEAKIAELSGKYLAPLRYYAERLSERLSEIETKFQSPDTEEKLRTWFKQIGGQVKKDNIMKNYENFCYYEGIFANFALYYTCSYFYCARELQFFRPFSEVRPHYSERLDDLLARATDAFAWGEAKGIYRESQEVIGERFRSDGTKMAYADMCNEHIAEEQHRRAPFYRPLDVFSDEHELNLQSLRGIRAALNELVNFLDNHSPIKADYYETVTK